LANAAGRAKQDEKGGLKRILGIGLCRQHLATSSEDAAAVTANDGGERFGVAPITKAIE
jgi:hypothetical protein